MTEGIFDIGQIGDHRPTKSLIKPFPSHFPLNIKEPDVKEIKA